MSRTLQDLIRARESEDFDFACGVFSRVIARAESGDLDARAALELVAVLAR